MTGAIVTYNVKTTKGKVEESLTKQPATFKMKEQAKSG
jgi:hypothetical protein